MAAGARPTNPTISVIMPAFNMERFVGEAIQSVLSQSFKDFELVIVNDGSTDRTEEAVKAFDDPRIVYVAQENRGTSRCLNRALNESRGRFVATLSADDVSVPERLDVSLRELERRGRGALFSAVELIDDESKPIFQETWASNLFPVLELTQAQVLARLFSPGNFLNACTHFMPRDLFDEFRLEAEGGPFNPLYLQLQDYDLWVRIAKRYPIWTLPQKLTRYRIRSSGGSLSSPSAEARRRTEFERYLLAETFFEGISDPLFQEAFKERLIRTSVLGPTARRCEEAFLFTGEGAPQYYLRGIEMLSKLLSKHDGRDALERHFGFRFQDFSRMLSRAEAFGPRIPQTRVATLYLDTGEGFTENQALKQIWNPHEVKSRSFDWDLSSFQQIRAIRFDPCEGEYVQARLHDVTLDEPLAISEVRSNGVLLSDQRVFFDHADPQFFISIKPGARVRKLAIQMDVLPPSHFDVAEYLQRAGGSARNPALPLPAELEKLRTFKTRQESKLMHRLVGWARAKCRIS